MKSRFCLTLLGIFLILFLINIASASQIVTQDIFGNSKIDFSPEEVVFIKGTGFSDNSIVIIHIIRPNLVVDYALTVSDSQGRFIYAYLLDGISGDYYVYATDGVNSAQVMFTDAAIWTTDSTCGDSSQDKNHYAVNSPIYINGNGFSSGSYSWSIKGQPGGASCDPNIVVASGIKSVNSSGSFCFNAYTVQNNDCGEYQVKFEQKGDNYRVEGNQCQNNADCGQASSDLSCLNSKTVKNTTFIPTCTNGACELINITSLKNCGNETSQLICQSNNVFNSTKIPACADGSCLNTTNLSFVKSCGTTSSSIQCIGNNITNITVQRGCSSGGCFNNTIINTIQQCQFQCTNGECINPSCGNNITDQGEECDDGNTNNDDTCTNSCTLAFCGDGIVRTGIEQCDDGNTNNDDGCSSSCQNETIRCRKNLDCGEDSFSSPFCSNLNVTQNFTFFVCNNPAQYNAFCSNFTTQITNQICENGCENGQCSSCPDKDHDGVCDTDDNCDDSKLGEPIDENGCDILQFCSKFSCGFDCLKADFLDNENVTYPQDCTIGVVEREGKLLQPICVPTVFSNMCAN